MEDTLQQPEDKREFRRKRRVRNEALAYAVVIILILMLAGGIFLAVKSLRTGRQMEEAVQSSQEQLLEDILGSEDVLPEPEQSADDSGSDEIMELTPEQKLDEIVNAVIEVMPLEDKVAGLFLVTPEAITKVSTAERAGEGTQKALSKYAVGGLIYFDKNIQSESQFKEMIENTKLFSKYPLFMAVDEEGGRVARLANKKIGTKVDTAAAIGLTGDKDKAYQAGVTLGANLANCGLNLDLAPVADLNIVEGSFIGDRSYGADVNLVSVMVSEVSKGIQSQGVLTCLKHFPGMGSTVKDPHKESAGTERTEEKFREEDLQVFKAGIEAGANMVMISNMNVPGLTGDKEPCVFSSRVVTDLLRNELGFEGVVITDAMNMATISTYYDSEESSIMALKAGCDMILMPEDFEKAYEGVINAVKSGTISEERINDSLRRIYRIKYADKLQKEE